MDRTEEARQVLTKWHGGDEADSQLVNYEMIEITTTIQQEKTATSSASYAEMFKTPGNRHRLFISVTLGIFGQWVNLSNITTRRVFIAHHFCRSATELSHTIWRLFWKLSASQASQMSLSSLVSFSSGT
jgi:hypothetical protein